MNYQSQVLRLGVLFGVVIGVASLRWIRKRGLSSGSPKVSRMKLKEMQPSRVLVATRIHQVNTTEPVDLRKVEIFIEQALGWDESFGVAITIGADGTTGRELVEQVKMLVSKLSARWVEREILVIAVSPWGKFVAGLNALVHEAVKQKYHHILFSSIETKVEPVGISALRNQMSASDFVIGAAFADHNFNANSGTEGKEVVLDGLTTPWNTLALWHVATLALVGFIGVAEGNEQLGVEGGVEEVTTIALIQHLLKPRGSLNQEESECNLTRRTGAKLVCIPGLTWANKFEDEERRRWHERKMKSKIDRPAKHLQLLPGLPAGTVLHITC